MLKHSIIMLRELYIIFYLYFGFRFKYAPFDNLTAIYISHRLSSCRFCDDIAVFHEGQLIQRGSHDRLIQDEQGKYYELWNAQAQYYTEKESA